jgi:hypothetical protein
MKRLKNVFHKCVLEFHYTSISGLGSVILSKKLQNRCILLFTESFLFERNVNEKMINKESIFSDNLTSSFFISAC